MVEQGWLGVMLVMAVQPRVDRSTSIQVLRLIPPYTYLGKKPLA
jgi:hypothetical protein